MGSADVYGAVESLPGIIGALVVGIERADGAYWMPLFVQLSQGCELDERLIGRVLAAVRDTVSPRHVPGAIIAVPGIPHTRTGKKLEGPVKRLLAGHDPARVVDREAVDEPALLDEIVVRANAWQAMV
jgi:acetoacetyl-CoA synthetase